MSKKNQYNAAEKLFILQELETGNTRRAVADKYEISVNTLVKWRRRYDLYGFKGLEIQALHIRYSAELKLQAVQDYLSGKYSKYQIIEKYHIASRTQLSNWIKKYNGHSSSTFYTPGGTTAMTKGRSTQWKERIEIVLYCLAQNRDYSKTAERYQVSYQQVYQWVKKYDAGGEAALVDGRGRNREPEELNESDRQQLKMKKLEAQNERLRAENAFLKKLQELERRGF